MMAISCHIQLTTHNIGMRIHSPALQRPRQGHKAQPLVRFWTQALVGGDESG
jgi:hypothetical protein